MRGKMDGEDDCKIEFDGRRVSVRFGRDYPVEGMRAEGDELVVAYAHSRSEKHEHRHLLNTLQADDWGSSLGRLDQPEALKHVRLLEAPEGTDGIYTFGVDRSLQESVRSMFEEALNEGRRRYGTVKGEVGENLISNLLTLANWEAIERHPFNERKKDGVSGNDTDHAFWDPERRLSISESKYWGNVEGSLKRGEIQVGAYYDRQRRYNGREVERAYVMAIEWNLNDDPIRVHVKRVRPKEERL
jgi:hypothetical protein